MTGTSGAPDRDLSTSPWEVLATREVYANPWITVREDDVRRPDGSTGIYGVVVCAGAVGVLPVLDSGEVVLVRQWRHVFGRAMWEIPTGGRHPGEDPATTAARELAEETGWHPTHLEPMGSFVSSKSVVDETCHLYLGTGLVASELRPDPTEFLTVARFPFDEVVRMVLEGEILDAMSVIAVLRADRSKSDPGIGFRAGPA